MVKRSIKSGKGISTAIGAVFFTLIVIVAFVTIWTINSYETRYQDVKTKMTEWDTQRISENLYIRSVENSAPSGYNLTLTVDNNGGALVNIARIYVYDQTDHTLKIYDPKSGTGDGFVNGTINTGEVNHHIAVKGTPLSSTRTYRIILATDKGRQFSYSYPPPSGGDGGGGYALILSDDQDNFQYASGTMTSFKAAFVKPPSTDHTLYRILMNNTTPRTIIFDPNCTMLQIQGAVGAITIRFVVSNQTQPPTQSINPTPFVSQTLGPFDSQYLYFGSNTVGGNEWQDEPVKKDYYLVGYVLYFKYQGETEIRNISLPAITQELK